MSREKEMGEKGSFQEIKSKYLEDYRMCITRASKTFRLTPWMCLNRQYYLKKPQAGIDKTFLKEQHKFWNIPKMLSKTVDEHHGFFTIKLSARETKTNLIRFSAKNKVQMIK